MTPAIDRDPMARVRAFVWGYVLGLGVGGGFMAWVMSR